MRSILRIALLKKTAGIMLGAVLCLTGVEAFAVSYSATQNGAWTNPATWGKTILTDFPKAGDIVTIGSGITVTADNHIVCDKITIDGDKPKLDLVNFNLTVTDLILSGQNSGSKQAFFSATTGTISISGVLNVTNYIIDFGTTTVKFNGSTIQDLPILPYNNILIDNPFGVTITGSGNLAISGNLTLFDNSKLNNGGKSITSSGTGKTLLMNANSEIILNGTTTLTSVTSGLNPSLAPTSIINYSATNSAATIPAGVYGKLVVNSAKTLTGDITLTGASTINAALTLNNRSLIIDDNNLTVTSTGSIIGGSATSYVKLGTGKLIIENMGTGGRTGNVVFPIGTSSSYTPATIANSGPAQSFSVGITEGVNNKGAALNHNVVLKTWNVTPSGTGANVALTLQWNAGDEAQGFAGAESGKNFNRTSCAINHFDSQTGKWDPKPVAFVAASGSGPFSVTRTGVQTFSPFAVGDLNSPLPVELISFTAVKKAFEVALTWETASEKNNTGFEVQSSTDGKNYEAVGFVATQNGTSSSTQRYAFSHKTANKEGLVYYRLKQIDLDGTFEYYTAKVVDLGRFTAAANVYPNPFQNQFELNLQATAAETAQILVTDMTGKTVYAAEQKLQKGANALKVELNDQPAGLYLLKATAGDQTYINRLVKQ